METRRDLLKMFGIGTVIAPAAGAGVLARLVEVPKVQLVEPRIVTSIDLTEVKSASLNVEMVDGSVHSFRMPHVFGKGRVVSGDWVSFDVALSIADGMTSPRVERKVASLYGGGRI